MIRVFLDANVYFAGFFSKEGASSVILELAHRKKITIVSSRLVLREADRNLRRKTDPKTLKSFHRYLQQVKIYVVPTPEDSALQRYESHIHPKDVPVLAATVESRADYLITLDRKHFFTSQVSFFSKKVKVLTPGDFLKKLLR